MDNKDKKKDTKETVQDILTKKLSSIVDDVVKNLGEEKPDAPAPVVDPPEKVVKKVAEPVVDPPEKTDVNAEVVKALGAITDTLGGINKRLEKIENPDAEVKAQHDEVVEKVTELAKTMGIDPESHEINFKIVEKKKGAADTTDDDEFKKKVEEDAGDSVEKHLEGADEETRKEALNKYFQELIYN